MNWYFKNGNNNKRKLHYEDYEVNKTRMGLKLIKKVKLDRMDRQEEDRKV